MNLFRISAPVVLATCLLAGCHQTPSAGSSGHRPPAEPADVASRDFGDYVLHFNAISTDQLTADVARTYDIVRSRNRALLTVAINRKAAPGVGVPAHGRVSVQVSNLTGQVKDLALREINEGKAVYYVGDLAVANSETLIFEIEATPEGEHSPMKVKFSRQFYSD